MFQAYIRMMFNKYSNGETMTVAGFEKLLKAIGIERLPLPSKPAPSIKSKYNALPVKAYGYHSIWSLTIGGQASRIY